MSREAAAQLLRKLDRELWLVTSAAGGDRGGLIATFVDSATITPDHPRILAGIAKQHHTWGLIERSEAFVLHLLGEEHLDWVWRFGLSSGRDRDKLDGLATRTSRSGVPILDGALAWLECRVEARLDTGDRTVYLADVLDASRLADRAVLTARRMFELAPDAIRTELQRQRARDGAVDAAAIEAWRDSRCRGEAEPGYAPSVPDRAPGPSGPGLASK